MTALSKSKPVVSMARLAQLLEERQEPFKLEVYLSERRYTKKSFDRIGSRKVKWRIAIPNGSKILKSAINKLVSYKNCQKSVHCKDRGIPAFGRGNKQQHNSVRNFTSLGFPLPCQSTFQASKLHNLRDLEVATNTKDSKQLSPVSVLEELPSNEAKKEEIKPISGFNFPRKAKSTYLCEFLLQSLTEKHNCVSKTELQDVKSSSDQHLKPKQVSMQTKQLLFNCVTEAMDTYGKQGSRQRSGREGLGPEEFGKVICEQISSLEKQYGDVKYINQLIDLNGTTEEWRNFQRWNKEIGKVIADAVLDDIITETINFELRSCFGFDTFFATDVRRFGDGGIFIGNLRKPVEEAIPKLERKLSEAAGTEVVLWLMEEKSNDITKQVCMVQPKAEMDLQFESTKLSTPWGYVSAITLCVATFGTIALMSGFFLKPNATFDDYVSDVVPLFGGFLSILGVSEIATRVTAARYGVKLSPSFLVPSNWTGCLGVMNNYESLLPNKKALFDIPVARTASAYLTSLVLAIAAFVADGSFNGGDNALYIRPQFFYNNPLLSFVQYVIGPYADDLGNVLPYAVEGVGVPVDPLAFAGLLGMVVTSLNLLPCGRLEGGRIAQAMFSRSTATLLSFATSLLLGIGGLSGSVLCLAWGLFATFFRGGEEVPAKDEITPLGDDRYAWGFILGLICFLTLFPNGGGTFSSSFFSDPFFRGDL